MTQRTPNGWPVKPRTRKLIVNGVEFVGGIADNDNVEAVFRYFWTQYNLRVEPLRNPGCWGGTYKPNANNAAALSNHASWTATDGNAPRHPNGIGVDKTFTPEQIAEVHKILTELEHVLRWGGDYHPTATKPLGYDSMHVEINVPPGRLQDIGKKIRTGQIKPPTTGTSVDQQAANNIESGKPIAAVRWPRVRDRMKQIVGRLRKGTEK